MNSVKVSACIITYNQAAYIAQCLEGALIQQLDCGYEIVIGDDCSTDGTTEICRDYAAKYPDKIRLVERSKNLGMNRNWKETLLACKGEYISVCEGDDYWNDPAKLQQQLDFLESSRDYVLAFHPVKVLYPDGTFGEDFLTKVPAQHESAIDFAKSGNYIHTPSAFFRNVVKQFPPEFDRAPIVDMFLYVLLLGHGKIRKLDGQWAVYRYGVGIFSSDTEIRNVFKQISLMSLLLSYLNDEQLKMIFLDRQKDLLTKLDAKTQYRYADNDFLKSRKTYRDLLKIAVKKALGK